MAKLNGANSNQVEMELLLALAITKKDYFSNSRKRHLYSTMEVMILCELDRLGKLEENRRREIMQFMEAYYDPELKNEVMVPFLYDTACRYEQEERYHQLYEIAQMGVDIICSGRSYLYLAEMHFMKVKAEEKLCKKDPEVLQRLYQRCKEIYWFLSIDEREEEMQQVEDYCMEVFGWPIIK